MLTRETFAKSKLLSPLHSLNHRVARNRLRKAVRYPVLSSGSSAHSHAIDKLNFQNCFQSFLDQIQQSYYVKSEEA